MCNVAYHINFLQELLAKCGSRYWLPHFAFLRNYWLKILIQIGLLSKTSNFNIIKMTFALTYGAAEPDLKVRVVISR